MPARRGNCYVASEALYHLFAKDAGYRPHWLKWRGDTHWFLAKKTSVDNYWYRMDVLDPSVKQWRKADRPGPEDYDRGRCSGFLTLRPSKRARALMRRLTWQTS